ncbi:DUF4129 domain-containing protein [Ornithinimicrobium panacihumi]|uniref:DUF4129 domain-containing protein n=1 Tax=Ornithinimicrobium panacihumi TaxID=2008449 RepID=UPI003F894D94
MRIPLVPVDPDRDQARTWLEEELARPGYTTERSLVSRVLEWIGDRLPSLDLPGQLPAWTAWVALAVVLVAALAVIAFGTRDRWRKASLADRRASPGAVLEEELTARDYRDRARSAMAAGDLDAALVDSYRAVAAGAVERTLLDDRPGRTAHEVALDLAAPFPAFAAELGVAGDRFDAVRYGDHHATAAQARDMAELEARLAAERPVTAPAPVATVPTAPSVPLTSQPFHPSGDTR